MQDENMNVYRIAEAEEKCESGQRKRTSWNEEGHQTHRPESHQNWKEVSAILHLLTLFRTSTGPRLLGFLGATILGLSRENRSVFGIYIWMYSKYNI